MRTLNKKQKVLIDKWYNKQSKLKTIGFFWTCDKDDTFTDIYEQIDKLNCFENLNSCIENYVFQKISNDLDL